MAAVVSIAVVATYFLASNVKQVGIIGTEAMLSARIAGDVLRLQKAISAVESKTGQQAATELKSAIEAILNAEDEIRTVLAHPDLIGPTSDVIAHARSFPSAFKKFTDAEIAMDAQRDKFLKGIERASELIAALTGGRNAADQSVASLMTADRRLLIANHQSEALVTGGDSGIFAQLKQNLSAAQSALSASLNSAPPKDKSKIQEILSEVSNLSILSDDLGSAHENRELSKQELDAIGPLLQDSIHELIKIIDLHLEIVTGRAASAVTFSTLIMLVLSLGAMTGGWIIAGRITRYVSKNLEKSVCEVTTLAEGDLEFEISRTHWEGEIGEIARALKVFQTNAGITRRLEAEQKAAEKEAAEREARDAKERTEAEDRQRQRAAEAREGMMNALEASVGAVVSNAALGDFSGRIESQFEEPQLQKLASQVNTLMENIEQGLKETARSLRELSKGRLTEKMCGDFKGLFSELQTDVNSTLQNLTEMVEAIEEQSGAVFAGSEDIADATENLAASAENQAAALITTATSIEQIARASNQNASNSDTIARGARLASEAARSAGESVYEAVQAMDDITSAAGRIVEIVEVMEGLAFQTNLLAVNASVEAARAGDAGKGFAVVATEVRALAQRSADASRDIKSLIDDTSTAVSRGVAKVNDTGDVLRTTAEKVQAMESPLEELNRSSQEQAAGVNQISEVLEQIDRLTRQNAEMAKKGRGGARQLRDNAATMQVLIKNFDTGSREMTDQSNNEVQTAPSKLKGTAA